MVSFLTFIYISFVFCVLFNKILGNKTMYDKEEEMDENVETSTVVEKEVHCNENKYEVWENFGSPRYILAPMVDASELPWRLLSRKYGAQLCYTPMVAAHMFRQDKKLRNDILQTTPKDRPLIVQFCGNDYKNLTEAAKLAEPFVDGIDINLGCPQQVAKRGHYGAYLQDEWPLLTELVSALRSTVKIPVSCKIRIYTDINKTIEYAQMLEKAGCQLLAVHGRTLDQRGLDTGLASWEHITAVRNSVSIPVFANGNIQCLEDVHRCLERTKVHGVMTAEGNLFNPALFSGINPVTWDIANEYLDLVDQYPVSLNYVRGHIFKIFHHLLAEEGTFDVRDLIGRTHKLKSMREAVTILRDRFIDYHEGRKVWNSSRPSSVNESSYNLYLPPWICQPYVRPTLAERESKKKTENNETKVRGYSVKRLKKERKLLLKDQLLSGKKKKLEICSTKNKNCTNPKGLTCGYNLCRTCCKEFCVLGKIDCIPHRHFKSKANRIEFENSQAVKIES